MLHGLTCLKPVIFIFAVFICSNATAQLNANDSINNYLSRLNNSSVTVIHNRFGIPGMNEVALALYQRANQHIADTLIDLLADTTKTLACHVLLTGLMDTSHKPVYHSTEDLTETIQVIFQYNGLSWQTVFDKVNLLTTIKIEPAAVKAVQQYWWPRKGKFVRAVPAVR